MPRDLSISDAAGAICAAPAPVLLMDTCAVVDVIRSPVRHSIANIEAALKLAEHARATPKRLYPIIAHVIQDEWSEHSKNEQENLKTEIAKHDRSAMLFRRACETAGITDSPMPVEFQKLDLPSRLFRIAEALIAESIVLTQDDECGKNAYHRNIRGVPPSRKGAGLKDCDIVEHYAGLCRQLVSGGFGEKVVLVSSNTNDFCEDKRNALHPVIETEFSSVDFQFSTNLAWARSALGF